MERSIDQRTKALISTIKSIRAGKDYTQGYIAAKLKISQNAYSKIELGHSSLTVLRLFQIAELLEVEVTELLNYGASDALEEKAEGV